MSLDVVWLAQAAEELMTAVRFYSELRPELGSRFAQAVDDAVRRIADAPLLYALVSERARRVNVEKFPYGLFYLVEAQRIVVLACFHAKRNPHIWRTRMI